MPSIPEQIEVFTIERRPVAGGAPLTKGARHKGVGGTGGYTGDAGYSHFRSDAPGSDELKLHQRFKLRRRLVGMFLNPKCPDVSFPEGALDRMIDFFRELPYLDDNFIITRNSVRSSPFHVQRKSTQSGGESFSVPLFIMNYLEPDDAAEFFTLGITTPEQLFGDGKNLEAFHMWMNSMRAVNAGVDLTVDDHTKQTRMRIDTVLLGVPA